MSPELAPPAQIEIALQPFKVGGRLLEPCDRFDEEVAKQLDEIHLKRLRLQRYLGPLTRDAYRSLITRRPPGTIGAGFTKDFLVEKGVLDPDDAVVETAEPYKGCFIRPTSGAFRFYQPLGPDGTPIRERPCKKREDAEAYIDAWLADHSTDSSASITPSVKPEGQDDSDLQSQPD